MPKIITDTSPSPEWSEWIDHDGSGVPLVIREGCQFQACLYDFALNVFAYVIEMSMTEGPSEIENIVTRPSQEFKSWTLPVQDPDTTYYVFRYRVQRSQAYQSLCTSIVEKLDA